MNDENSQKKSETQATPAQEQVGDKPTGDQVTDSLVQGVKGDGPDRQLLRTFELKKETDVCDAVFVNGSREQSIVDFNSNHVMSIVNRNSVFFGNINKGPSNVFNLTKYFGGASDSALSGVFLSTCFKRNYAIVFTTDNQLLVFILKSNDDEVDLIRYPFKIKLSDKPSISRWKDNVFYFTVGSKLQGIVFQELPNKELDSIDADEVGNCCSFFDLYTAKSKIVELDVSCDDLICVSTGDTVTVYSEELSKVQLEFGLGDEDDKVVMVRNKSFGGEEGSQGKRSLMYCVTEKGKLYIHNFKLLMEKGEKDARIAEQSLLDLFKLPGDTKLACDGLYINHTGSYLVLNEKKLDKTMYIWWNNPADPQKNKLEWRSFEAPLNKDTLISQVKYIELSKQLNLVFGNGIQDSTSIYFSCSLDNEFQVALSMINLAFLCPYKEPIKKPKTEDIMGEQQLKNLFMKKDNAKEQKVEQKETQQKVSKDENILNKIQDTVYNNATSTQNKPAKMQGLMSLADVERGLMEKASVNPNAKQEDPRKSSFKEKLAQKKDIKSFNMANKEEKPKEPESQPDLKPKYEKQESSATNQPTEQQDKKVKKKKKPKDDGLINDLFIKKLSEIFGTFHEQLTRKVNRIMDDSKKTIIRDFQSSLNTSLKEFKRTYGDEMATKSEKEIIPYLEKCIYKTFEKYTISLKTTYTKYCEKIESENNSQQILTKNIESIFNAHLSTATKLERSINLFMKVLERHNKHDKQEQKEEENNVLTMLQTIAANQQLMNNAFIDMNNKISKLQVDLENLKQTQRESSQSFKKALEMQKLAMTTGDKRFMYDQMDSPKLTETKSEMNLPIHHETGNDPNLMKKKESGDFIEDGISENSNRRKSVKDVFSMPFANPLMFINQKPPDT